jgi:nucleoside 2-deoxyribosyltransferase
VNQVTLEKLLSGGQRPRCYIASPLGFSEATKGYYEHTYLPELRKFVEPVDPWASAASAQIAVASTREELRATFFAIGQQNSEGIASASMLIAHLDGQEVDSGTAAEVGYAAGRSLPCLGVRNDQRQSGEPEMAVNLQVESFIMQSGGFVAASLAELIAELRRLSK